MPDFQLVTDLKPKGDQPKAIKQLGVRKSKTNEVKNYVAQSLRAQL